MSGNLSGTHLNPIRDLVYGTQLEVFFMGVFLDVCTCEHVNVYRFTFLVSMRSDQKNRVKMNISLGWPVREALQGSLRPSRIEIRKIFVSRALLVSRQTKSQRRLRTRYTSEEM